MKIEKRRIECQVYEIDDADFLNWLMSCDKKFDKTEMAIHEYMELKRVGHAELNTMEDLKPSLIDLEERILNHIEIILDAKKYGLL